MIRVDTVDGVYLLRTIEMTVGSIIIPFCIAVDFMDFDGNVFQLDSRFIDVVNKSIH